VVGAFQDDDFGTSSGSTYVFVRTTGTEGWSMQAKLLASDGSKGDSFGSTVALDADKLIVGSFQDDDLGQFRGSSYVFLRPAGSSSWNEPIKLTASDGAASDEFGRSVSVSGDTMIVGSPQDADSGISSGSAYVYKLHSKEP